MGVRRLLTFVIASICLASTAIIIERQSSDPSGEEPGLVTHDSDYCFLFMAQSTLPVPGIGVGVFAKLDIPEGEIICEYRGQVGEPLFAPHSDKRFSSRVENTALNLVGNTICAYINDCAWIYNNSFTFADIDYFMRLPNEDSIPAYPGFEYNAKYAVTKMGKVFINSTKHIKAGSEIFYSYGRSYWEPRLRKQVRSKRADILGAFYRSQTLNLSVLPKTSDFSIGFYN